MTSDAGLDAGRLQLLREVGLRGTIAGAGRALGLTASAVSQQLAVLEREAGTALIDRSPRGVALTAAGRALAERAGEMRDVLLAARADLDRLTGALGGPVRIAAVASAAIGFVSAAVADLAAAHADIDVAVTAAEPVAALDKLLAGDVDLAVVDEYDYVPLALPDYVVAHEALVEPLVLTVPAGWTGPRRPTLATLARHDWVMPPEDAACGLAVRSACRAAGFEPRVRWTSDDLLVLARAVAAGHGVAVLPRLSVADRLPGVDVAGVDVLDLREAGLSRRLRVVARASVLARPTVAAVRDAVVHAARDSDHSDIPRRAAARKSHF